MSESELQAGTSDGAAGGSEPGGASWPTAMLLVGLLAAGALSWTLMLRPDLIPNPEVLERVPMQLGSWLGEPVPVEGSIEKMLAADFNLQRTYVQRTGEVVWLYVGYYGTRRGGRPEHTPWECYPSNGWEIVEDRRMVVDPSSGRRAVELLVRDGERERLVHFWYQSHRRLDLLDGFEQAMDRMVGRVMDGRADGSLVRLSTPLHPAESIETARARLTGFGARLVPHLAENWPGERPEETG